MAYYNRIARQWHRLTGRNGGAFKEYVLNDALISAVRTIDGQTLLELGAGNGYFIPILLGRLSGQHAAGIVITDVSDALLNIARQKFKVKNAEYLQLDARAQYPFPPRTFDVILATMVFNEIGNRGWRAALQQCNRVLADRGRLIMTVAHPEFVGSLARRGQLRREASGLLTMPGAGNLRLPVVDRSRRAYERALAEAGFRYEAQELYPTQKVLNKKPILRTLGNKPIALVFNCSKSPEENKEGG